MEVKGHCSLLPREHGVSDYKQKSLGMYVLVGLATAVFGTVYFSTQKLIRMCVCTGVSIKQMFLCFFIHKIKAAAN